MNKSTEMPRTPRVPMCYKPTQAEIDALHVRANVKFDAQCYDEDWKNDLASDLNAQITRVLYCLETTADSSDYAFGVATMNIVERVAHFEELTIQTL
jgi:hypothetical protein